MGEEMKRLKGSGMVAEPYVESIARENRALRKEVERLGTALRTRVLNLEDALAAHKARLDMLAEAAKKAHEELVCWHNLEEERGNSIPARTRRAHTILHEALREPAGKSSPKVGCCEPVMSAEQEPESLKRLQQETRQALSRVKPADAGEGGEE